MSPGSWRWFRAILGNITFWRLLPLKKNTFSLGGWQVCNSGTEWQGIQQLLLNRCLGGLRMEDQGEWSPQTFLGRVV